MRSPFRQDRLYLALLWLASLRIQRSRPVGFSRSPRRGGDSATPATNLYRIRQALQQIDLATLGIHEIRFATQTSPVKVRLLGACGHRRACTGLSERVS